MIIKKVKIINKLGLHARAAAKFVQLASHFTSHIEVTKDGQSANGKSIMSVMMLGASKNTWIELNVTGEDEKEALLALEALINQRFGEPD